MKRRYVYIYIYIPNKKQSESMQQYVLYTFSQFFTIIVFNKIYIVYTHIKFFDISTLLLAVNISIFINTSCVCEL